VSFNGVAGDGTGQTIAIIDAYNDPTILQDLATFDQTFNLQPANLTVVIKKAGRNCPRITKLGRRKPRSMSSGPTPLPLAQISCSSKQTPQTLPILRRPSVTQGM